MLRIKFNRKFKKIIALSTLAALWCSSNLIQSIGEKDYEYIKQMYLINCEKINVTYFQKLINVNILISKLKFFYAL